MIRSPSSISRFSYGYITLLSVLVVGALGVATATALILLGLGSSRTSAALEDSNHVKALANACADEALQVIRDSTAFTGSGGFSLGKGTCTYTVASGGGETRTVNAAGTVGGIVRKVKVTLDAITPRIRLISWQEVADF